MGTEDRELWLDDVNDAFFFYCDIPPLPDFHCMSSSSSSSSAPAPVKAITCSSSASTASSSSSATSWAVLKSEVEEDNSEKMSYSNNCQHTMDAPTSGALSSTASMEIPQPHDPIDGVDDCMDVMEDLSYMDLLDNNDFFDPSSIFHRNDSLPEGFHEEQNHPQQALEMERDLATESRGEDEIKKDAPSEDLAMVFMEWLKVNKETVSAEDLRRVKIKKSTIECAARRLGGGREAMKQLLKLILEWVRTNHLQRRRLKESAPVSNNNTNLVSYQFQDPFQNPNPNSQNQIPPSDLNPCLSQAPWISLTPCAADPTAIPHGFSPAVGYVGDPFGNGAQTIHPHHPYQPSADNYHVMDCPQTWQLPRPQFAVAPQYSSFPDSSFGGVPPQPAAFPVYSNQYPYQYPQGHNDQRLMRLGSSATKEARKKRMARQRRLTSYHRTHHHHNSSPLGLHPNQSAELQARMGGDNGEAPTGQVNLRSWIYWPSVAGGSMAPNPPMVTADNTPVMPVLDRPAVQATNDQRQQPTDKRQGWKPQKNLRFLLQKVLKQSDVGNLGRIVLPKKEAETHLPELEARDGISIAMADIGTSRVWNMRYRFWPNNKSRMYLLENTGEFVRANGLQEGDFIVIYSDVKCGNYLIRGVKVRQSGTKPETKRSGKAQRNQHASSPSANKNNNTNNSSDPSSSPPNSQTLT